MLWLWFIWYVRSRQCYEFSPDTKVNNKDRNEQNMDANITVEYNSRINPYKLIFQCIKGFVDKWVYLYHKWLEEIFNKIEPIFDQRIYSTEYHGKEICIHVGSSKVHIFTELLYQIVNIRAKTNKKLCIGSVSSAFAALGHFKAENKVIYLWYILYMRLYTSTTLVLSLLLKLSQIESNIFAIKHRISSTQNRISELHINL